MKATEDQILPNPHKFTWEKNFEIEEDTLPHNALCFIVWTKG
jgi:hypothetical protein